MRFLNDLTAGSSPVTRTNLNNDIGKEYMFFALLLYNDYPPIKE